MSHGGLKARDSLDPFCSLVQTRYFTQTSIQCHSRAMDDNKTTEIAEAREDAPEVVEDETLKSAHMNYELVDEEVAKYASETIVQVDEATSKRLKQMIDKRVLAIMIGTYLVQTLDKGTMSFASIMGIIPQTHLHGTQVCAS